MVTPSAPIVLLGYRRPTHTRQVFDAIRRAQPAELFLVMDGPRDDSREELTLVSETRKMVEEVDWECSVHRIYADVNLGLKKRVSTGLDEVFASVDRAIILEDDCFPSPTFFPFASELLELYADDDRVGIISGSQRLRGRVLSDASYEFSNDVRIWGWATWARTWRTFRQSGDLEVSWTDAEASRLGEMFAPGPRRKSMVSMMRRSGQLDSWALPFAVHCVRQGYLNAVSGVNLISNTGLGGSSTHTAFESYVAEVPREDIEFPLRHPTEVKYLGQFDEIESRLDARERWLYPLKHPLDTVRRVYRFVKRMFQNRMSH